MAEIIGIGNQKGGVGSTTLVREFTARLSSKCFEPRPASSETHTGNCNSFETDTRDSSRSKYCFLDYSNTYQKIESVMDASRYWICPFGPEEHDAVLSTFMLWRKLGYSCRRFVGVINGTPSNAELDDDPGWATSRYTGDDAVFILARTAPELSVLHKRIPKNHLFATSSSDNIRADLLFEKDSANDVMSEVWQQFLRYVRMGHRMP